jgi:hypothetical protein
VLDILRPVRAPHRTAWLRVCLVVFATAVAALAATGVAPVGAQTPPLRVAMVGDSVMLGARDQLLAQFAGMPVTVDAIEDRSLLGAIDMFQSAGPALGDVVVLDLGYNDSSDPTVFRERIDGAMAALAGVKHVIWLNQHEFRPDRAGMNAELNAAASRYANLEVVDWNAEVAAHPEDVYGDAIHLTPAGQAAMAVLVRQRFDQFITSLTPTTTAAPTTTTIAAAAHRPASQQAAGGGATDDSGSDRDTVVVIAVGIVALALVVVTVVARRRRSVRR